MAGTSVVTLAADSVVMKFKEPFLTKALNQKMSVNTPAGVYQGFRLAPTNTALTIEVNPDPVTTESSAVYQTTNGESLTVSRRGSFLIKLNPFAGKKVAIAIFASYAIGIDTFAELRVYELDPTDELTGSPEERELVILGTVTVPLAGLIPADDITATRRVSAWQRNAPESITWAPLIRNPSFEWGDTSVSPAPKFASAFWEITADADAEWDVSTGNPNVGAKHMELTYVGPGDTDSSLFQRPNVPVVPGQLIRAQLFKQLLQIPTTGAMFVWARFVTSAGGSVIPSVIFTHLVIDSLLSTSVDLSYQKFDVTFEVPPSAAHLTEIGVLVNDATFPLAAPAFRVDDVQFWLETMDPESPFLFEDEQAAKIASSVVIRDPDGVSDDREVLLTFDKDSPADGGRLTIERRDQQTGVGFLPPALDLIGRISNLGSGVIDTDVRAALPRVSAPIATAGVSSYTLLWESTSVTATTASARLYATDEGNGGMILTTNARFSAGVWTRDLLAEQSTKFSILGGRIVTESVAPDFAPATWTDSQWQESSPFVSQRRVDTLLTDGRTLLWEMRSPIPFATALMAHIRIYLTTGFGDQLEITMNAEWNGTTGLWDFDQTPPAGLKAVRITLANQIIEMTFEQRSTAGAWTDNQWDSAPFFLSSFVGLLGLQDLNLRISANTAVSNPSPLTPFGNTLTASSMVKSYGTVASTGAGLIILSSGGFNCSLTLGQVGFAGATTTIFYPFPLDFGGTIVLSVDAGFAAAGANDIAQPLNQTPTQFQVQVREASNGTLVNLAANQRIFHFVVYGIQTLP